MQFVTMVNLVFWGWCASAGWRRWQHLNFGSCFKRKGRIRRILIGHTRTSLTISQRKKNITLIVNPWNSYVFLWFHVLKLWCCRPISCWHIEKFSIHKDFLRTLASCLTKGRTCWFSQAFWVYGRTKVGLQHVLS